MGTINPFGKDIIKVETELCGRPLSLEVGRVGFRTSASVIARYGDTVVLGTAMVSKNTIGDMDYFPLSIDYEERFYAAGKISGSRFVKREGRPSDDAILISRLIDRPIRPLWPKGYRQEVQGVTTVLSMDPLFRPDMVAMIALSAAFMLTGAPFDGPVAGVRVGLVDDKFVAFATPEELATGPLDLVVAGTKEAIMMVEAGASEVSEEQIAEALAFAHEAMQPAIVLQQELVQKVGVTPLEYEVVKPDEDLQQRMDTWVAGKLGTGLRVSYPERNDLVQKLKSDMYAHFEEEIGEDFAKVRQQYDDAFTVALHKDVRQGIIEEQVRPDGRGLRDIRPLSSEVGLLPRAHGSSIFTRGLTQAMNIITLAPLSYAQMIDTMERRDEEKRYMHHYNAPGYTVGEVRRLGSPGRREIGHSALAERALWPVLPAENDFPYAIRSVTEIMSQNGSTSMAATCSSCLALMDAGVPLSSPVSGIAMGLMLGDDGKPYILSDIADAEDFAGDMDFKVTGTEKGITALQMDMKVHGLGVDILKQALMEGKEGRAVILKHMLETLPAPREELSPHAPRIETITINPDKVRDVIGKGGETINKIIENTGVEIDIKDGGIIMIAATDQAARDAAIKWIRDLTVEPEVGKIYDATVVTVTDFGAFVEFLPGQQGLVHVSEMADSRIENPRDIVSEGDQVKVKLVEQPIHEKSQGVIRISPVYESEKANTAIYKMARD
jgi:polyribonucleotide nucleotidyltransferase